MTNTDVISWETKRTAETRQVEDALRRAGFKRADAYRYNSASIRVRVIDPKFEGLSAEKRDELVEPAFVELPERTQADIISLFTFAPSELDPSGKSFRESMMNVEFENPTPSML